MSEPAPENVVVTPSGVITGVEPPARVPSINQPPAPISSTRSEQPGTDADKVFTTADIEKARQQEKDKVYGRIDALTERLRVFEEERSQRETAEAQTVQQKEDAARQQAEAEMDLRTLLQTKEQEWQAQLAAEKQERERAFALLDKERELSALQAYRAEAVRANEDNILPELQDEVVGSTPEEVDASIARLIAKTSSILENVGAVAQQQRQAQPSARVTAPPVGPLESETAQRQYTAEEIAAMPLGQFEKLRGQLGVTGGNTHRGLFDR